MKPLTEVILDRRATPHFKEDPVPQEYLDAILQFAAQAPSGYNLQPWRFVVVRKKENRERLQKAAYNQEKIIEAPVVVIAFGGKNDWKNYIDEILEESISRGVGKPETVVQIKKRAAVFLENAVAQDVWLNRHTMIAVTTMMLVAESYGLDTAPMEGFDPEAVAHEFGLPSNAEIVALLAIGFARKPDNSYAGRFPLSEIVHDEHFGRRWNGDGQNGRTCAREIGEQIERKATEKLQPA